MAQKPLEDMTLHELGHQRDVLDVFLAAQEGEVDADLQNILDKLEGTRDQKIERWGRYLLREQARIEAITMEERRLGDRKAVLTRAYEASRAQLKYEMERQGVKEVRGQLCDVVIQLNNPSVDVAPTVTPDRLEAWASLESPFVRVKPATYDIDKRAVLAFAKEHPQAALPDGLAIVRTSSVRIK